MVLTDSNILVQSVQTRGPHYLVTESAIAKLRTRQETLCIAPQNVVEFWSVATRPPANKGMGLSAPQASAEVANILRLFRLVPYTRYVLEIWRALC